jgi:hypothetical protein
LERTPLNTQIWKRWLASFTRRDCSMRKEHSAVKWIKCFVWANCDSVKETIRGHHNKWCWYLSHSENLYC